MGVGIWTIHICLVMCRWEIVSVELAVIQTEYDRLVVGVNVPCMGGRGPEPKQCEQLLIQLDDTTHVAAGTCNNPHVKDYGVKISKQ